jgi:hypothetical protein
MDGSSTGRHQATPDDREPYGLFADSEGNLRIGGLPRSYREGFGSLLDLFHPPARFRVMPEDEMTRLSFEQVGAALRQAMAAWRSRPVD